MPTDTIPQVYEAREYINPEALVAAAGYVQREYGLTGYRVGVVMSSGAVTLFAVRHADGSMFNLCADKWGSVKRPESDSLESAQELMRDMHRMAVTP